MKPSPPRFRSFARLSASPLTRRPPSLPPALLGFGSSARRPSSAASRAACSPGGMGPQPMGEEPKEEGPAEEAPEEEQQPQRPRAAGRLRRPVPARHPGRPARRLPAPAHRLLPQAAPRPDLHDRPPTAGGTGRHRRRQLSRTPPFPLPLECPVDEARCSSKNLGSGNLRLRLEPDHQRHRPGAGDGPGRRPRQHHHGLDARLAGQLPPAQRPHRPAPSARCPPPRIRPRSGVNGLVTSIRAKRAWGEVDSEFGSLRFGRMPWHFGRGIAFNNGNCPDCDGGTTVDRIMALTQLYGHQVALSWDFGAQGHHIGLIDLGTRDPERPAARSLPAGRRAPADVRRSPSSTTSAASRSGPPRAS